MAKTRYVCGSCGAVQVKWMGQCPDCGAWNSLEAEAVQPKTPFAQKHSLSSGGTTLSLDRLDAAVTPPARLSCGIAELDRTLGGGFVAGSALLLGGDPGIGKSTLLLQSAALLAGAGRTVVYVSGEESVDQVRLRAKRLGLEKQPVTLANATSTRDILTTLSAGAPPDLLVVDSIQTMHSDTLEGAPGTVGQVRASAMELIRYAKQTGTIVVLIGHVTKDGQIAGPRVLEHMVDTVLYFEGERGHRYRILRAVKNRFGGTDEIGVFSMTAEGLKDVPNPSALFLTTRDTPVSGSVVFPCMEGVRPVLVELQALTVRVASGATPRRAVVGWDGNRLSMILAVLETRCGVRLSSCEVYLNVASGLKINDPAADLAVAAALVSAMSDIPLPEHTVVMGEIALSGEVRNANHIDLRLKEAHKLGFTHAIVPSSADITPPAGMKLTRLGFLRQLVDQLAKGA